MKRVLLFILFGILGTFPVFAQEVMTFHILKIKKIKNECYKLTAISNGEKYTIYSHYYDGETNKAEKIKPHDKIELNIIPFFKTAHLPLAELKKEIGTRVISEDSTCSVNVTFPLNYQSLITDYYGNKIKIKKKMYYYTLDINGIFKK